MSRVKFTVDGKGPFQGAMRFGTYGDGEIEFIAVNARRNELQNATHVAVVTENAERFDAPISNISCEPSRFDDEDGTATGFIVFETI